MDISFALDVNKNLKSRMCNEKNLREINKYDELMGVTSFLNEEYSIRERLLCLKFNITQAPRCKTCGNKTKQVANKITETNVFNTYCSYDCGRKGISKPLPEIASKCTMCDNDAKPYFLHSKGYSKFCGKTCQNLYTACARIGEKYITKDWWYNAKVNEHKTIAQISKETGLSKTLVTRYLTRFELKAADERRPKHETNQILFSKEKLFDLYETQQLKVAEVAEKINSSPGTVSLWLEHHNIETREPNSYDRESGISGEEEQVLNFCQSIYDGEILSGKRGILGNRELDIYIPGKNYAIEYNGLYSHCFKPEQEVYSIRKDKTYHLSKTTGCEEQGITLFHLFSDEWKFKQEIVKSMIRSRLGLNENKIYARECECQSIESGIKNWFLDESHLQGQDKSNMCFGLFSNRQLVAVMTFTRKKFSADCDWELNRFATLCNYTITGAFSKLLKFAISCGITGKIVTYADRRYSQGNVYDKNGFTLRNITPASYGYVSSKENYQIRHHRLWGTKENLRKMGGFGDTELELATSLNIKRIYDCGVKVYVYDTDLH